MPLENAGTLLENVALIHGANAVCQHVKDHNPGIVDFASSFAMAPLSPWREGDFGCGLGAGRRSTLVSRTEPPTDLYSALLRRCLEFDPAQGPNGALLIALLASEQHHNIRFWLNDHAGSSATALGQLAAFVGRIRGEPAPILDVVASKTAYPASLDRGADSLKKTVDKWRAADSPAARVGFLDPMHYSDRGPRGGTQTSSVDHQRWLEHLCKGVGLACSVHFSGNRNASSRQSQQRALRRDADISAGFHSFTALHSNYTVTLSVWCADNHSVARGILSAARDEIESAWRQAQVSLGGGKCPLRFEPEP